MTRQKDTIRLVAWAIPPIALGATRPEVYVIVATPAMASEGLLPLRPAAAKHSGTTTAMPSPSSANPVIARAGLSETTMSRPPSVARMPPERTVRTAP